MYDIGFEILVCDFSFSVVMLPKFWYWPSS